jgi:hypothetical protein
MFVRIEPLWLWNLVATPDEQYLSQPTAHFDPWLHRTMVFDVKGACVARCQITTWVSEGDRRDKTHDIQCGQLATLSPDGHQYLCAYHFESLWMCRHCHAVLANEIDEYCSPACQAAYEQMARDTPGWGEW